jgi:hypothetical protein
MATIQNVRMVVVTLMVLAAIGWLPWVLIGSFRRRLNGWIAAPFLGLAVLEVFAWYWLEFGTGGLRVGYVLLGSAWIVATVAVVIRARGRNERFLPPLSRRGVLAGILLVTLAVALSSVIMMRSLQGNEPVPSTYGNADSAQYALSAEIYFDEGFDGIGWISTGELGGFGRYDNAAVRPYLTSVALMNGTEVWIAATPAMTVMVILAAIAVAWLVLTTTRAGPMAASLLGVAALLPFTFTFIVGHYYLAQVAAMASGLAFAALLIDLRPSTWRQVFETCVTAVFFLIPVMLSYPQMSLGLLAVVGSVVVAIALDSLRRGGVRDLATEVLRSASVVVLAALGSLLVLAPTIPGMLDRINAVKDIAAGWPLPLLSPVQALGLEKFGPMTESSRSALIGPTDPLPITNLQWWSAAMLVIAVCGLASFVSWIRKGRLPLFSVVTATVVLVSYRMFYALVGDSYQQWKWITYFVPLLAVAVLVAFYILFEALISRFPQHRAPVSVSIVVVGSLLLSLALPPLVGLWSQPWWYVTDELADVRRVTDSGIDHVNVDLDPYAETMWAAYLLARLPTNLVSLSYFPTTGVTSGWTLTKRKYVKTAPLQEIPLNAEYLLVCYSEPCSPAPVLVPTAG